MLEKIGLPAKPSLRGSAWVVDASHCQGCSSQFTFINRKHHCRRCGGLFCNSCTQQRMVLRGQGDSPVRICDPCKTLEEAVRFEFRHGYKNRAAKGSSKMIAKHEDDVLNEILGADADVFSSSESTSSVDRISSKPKSSSSASFSNATESARTDGIELNLEAGSASPEELRRQAMEEKKKYRALKGEGKSDEALRAFKRGKEIERQAEALEMSLRKNRKRVLSLGNVADVESKCAAKEPSKTRKPPHQGGKEKDNFAAELRELGWTDDDDKKPPSLSLEGELSSLLREVPTRTSQEKGDGIDKAQVNALKKKALMLKREGKLAEAKEELKRAKVLERQLEEQDLLAGAEDSDDELSAIIRSMDDDKEDDLFGQYEQSHDLDIGSLLGNVDHVGVDGDLDVTDEDMVDPEIAAALTSIGWTEDSRQSDNTVPQSTPSNREECLAEIQSLKRKALNLKRAGSVAEAMATLKKAKLLEKELEAANMSSKIDDMAGGNSNDQSDLGPKLAPKSRLVIQKELLVVKKKALALRREGRFHEAEEEMKKGTVLQSQLDELDNSSKVAAVITGPQKEDLVNDRPYISEKSLDDDGEVDVTDQDLNDPMYVSLLRSLGWDNEDKPPGSSSETSNQGGTHRKTVEAQDAKDILGTVPRKSKIEIQRELLGLKRKALALRREGNADEAEEVLKQSKALEAQITEIDSGKNHQADHNLLKQQSTDSGINGRVDEVDDDVTEKDMRDPALLSVLKNLGWEDEEPTSLPLCERPLKQAQGSSMQSSDPSMAAKTKGQIQRELLDLKRKALALRRNGESGEAEKLLRKANALEAQMAELEAPKNEPMLDASRAGSSLENESIVDHGNHKNATSEVGVSKVSVVQDASSDTKLETKGLVPPLSSPNFMDVGLLAEFGRKEAMTDSCFPGNDNTSIPSSSQLAHDNFPLLGEFNSSDEAGSSFKHGMVGSGATSQPGQHGSIVDLLTGDYGKGSQIPTGKGKEELDSDLGVPSLTKPLSQTVSLATPNREAQNNDNSEQRVLHGYSKPDNYVASSVQNISSPDSQHLLRQEILAHKRKAIALKREGKLIEAKDALRQAKLLEKSLDGNNSPPEKLGPDDPVSTTQASSSTGQQENSPSSSAPKPLSGRNRFKIQQESLSHKRQALKLRREGRLQEAEAEFEMAKSLEVQLEESTSHESSKSEPVDDVVVEDLLDPQLLSALKAIGLDDAITPSKSLEKPGPAKTTPEALISSTAKESPNPERTQLEERIKAEKVKAVTFKRAGKQAEALDALRRAKLYEKKLNTLASK